MWRKWNTVLKGWIVYGINPQWVERVGSEYMAYLVRPRGAVIPGNVWGFREFFTGGEGREKEGKLLFVNLLILFTPPLFCRQRTESWSSDPASPGGQTQTLHNGHAEYFCQFWKLVWSPPNLGWLLGYNNSTPQHVNLQLTPSRKPSRLPFHFSRVKFVMIILVSRSLRDELP